MEKKIDLKYIPKYQKTKQTQQKKTITKEYKCKIKEGKMQEKWNKKKNYNEINQVTQKINKDKKISSNKTEKPQKRNQETEERNYMREENKIKTEIMSQTRERKSRGNGEKTHERETMIRLARNMKQGKYDNETEYTRKEGKNKGPAKNIQEAQENETIEQKKRKHRRILMKEYIQK